MAETITLSELIVPGTYIQVRAEGLIGVGGISTGNIGIVGASAAGTGETFILSDYEGAQVVFGKYTAEAPNITRAIELLYQNGARTVFARAVPLADANDNAAYIAAFNELAKDQVNIVVAPQLTTQKALQVLGTVLETAENSGRDMIAVVGSDATKVSDIKAQVAANDRIILVAPGIRAYDSAAKADVSLSGVLSAAAVAGLLSTLAPQVSPTNKVFPGVGRLAQRFSYGETKELLGANVLVLEERQGVRVVRGLTTEGAAFKQITTRRIVDFAKQGIRQASDPFIGRLNNQRVRKALYAAIDGFLTTMVQDEALTGYTLAVTATRQDEINGRAMVNAVLRPTFSIDFVAVTLVLE
jgi:hypothetical protein